MSPNVTGWLLVLALSVRPGSGPAPGCAGATDAVLTAAATTALAGEFATTAQMLATRLSGDAACPELVVATRAWRGWLAAVAAGSRGGTDEALTDVRTVLEAFGSSAAGATDQAYAVAVLRAAAAAAQDERDEMQVWLEHARAVAARRALVDDVTRWPLPIDLVDGELWSSVDDYELAEASYTRALAGRDSALAWRGLARARDRRGNRTGACAAYRRAFDLAAAGHPAGTVATEARGYLLVCER